MGKRIEDLKRTRVTVTFNPQHSGGKGEEAKDLAYLNAMGLSYLEYQAEHWGIPLGEAAKAIIIQAAIDIAQAASEAAEEGRDGPIQEDQSVSGDDTKGTISTGGAPPIPSEGPEEPEGS